jgi:D-threo-aldose 1-dehydrogenase
VKDSLSNTTEINLPPIIFGTSCLGNLYQAIPYETKLNILKTIIDNSENTVVLDSAGKYGAGLALETIGKGLKDLQIPADQIQISNKLGWYRISLTTTEPTFETGAWIDLDWVMFSVSFTIFSHPPELLEFIAELSEKGIVIQ